MSINKITFLGHSGILIESNDQIIGVDPWLSGPTCPEEFKTLKKLDTIILTLSLIHI